MGSLKVTMTDVKGETRTFDTVDEGLSLMEVAKANGVEGIFGDCGGGCSCATCHVYVAAEWMEKVGQPDDIEMDMLDMAAEPRAGSRLSCQIKMSAELDGIEVTVAPSA
ncbi:2Fe-2S iron-sulfur cluster-binding protein [Novosphingobium sp.]|uniref:2Fe-2S iron-sulfur cluster-binding protein n=1 Tax=Novosphingobium sp. TaxID=1874826 RepID=UPI00286DD4A2|nr:2Fe-2S iron-sulfur cluster-binding protein [Novosphingobium sp.]